MTRLIYWSIVTVELILLLVALLLFIITDSRTIKYIAKPSLGSSKFTYEAIEGNIFNGLDIRGLKYDNKPLFDSARIHWNPLTLVHNKITITQVDAQGIELENILSMLTALGSNKREDDNGLKLSLVLEASHFDINPYLYEGVKFSSFVLEAGDIKIDEDLKINTGLLYLKFDSDIANVQMNAKVEESILLVDKLELKNISTRDISRFTRNIRKKVKKESKSSPPKAVRKEKFMPIKEIRVKHTVGTMKAVKYSDLKIASAKLNLYNATIDPYDNFQYQVEKLDLKGKTNFGKLDYKGYVKDSTIYATGDIRLNKLLFSTYKLPLNFRGLQKLPSKLRLTHDAVSLEIKHKVAKLLRLKSDFNIDVSKGMHKLHYDYKKELFTIKSNLLGKMSYADEIKIDNSLKIDKDKFSYKGEVTVKKIKSLPKLVSDYLVREVKGVYKADTDNFEMDIDSNLFTGKYRMPKYEKGILDLKSKGQNIALKQLLPDIPNTFKNEKLSFSAQSFFNFQNIDKSIIKLSTATKTLDVEGRMNLEEPYKISFLSKIKNDRLLKASFPSLKFSRLENLRGEVLFKEHDYFINIQNDFLELFVKYNATLSTLKDAKLNLEGQTFELKVDRSNTLGFNTKIKDIQRFLEKINAYYDVEIPSVRGEGELELRHQENGTTDLTIKSPKLQYLSSEGVNLELINFYNVELSLAIDKSSNIVLKAYQFKLDDNGYLNMFYSTKQSHLALNNNLLNIRELWLNDEIKVSGNYDIETLQGNLKVNTDGYTLRTKDFALILAANLKVKVDKNKFDIEGDIDILGDTITYEVVGTDIVEDSDIIIMKDMLQNKESAFNAFKLYVKINSKKPLKYITDDINVEFFNELSIVKNYNQEMLVTGMSTITKGEYILEDKVFLLDESHLYFTGDIKKPLLDIKANYEKDEYNVRVYISGTTENPIVNFRSEPFLTQQEILSLILFDGTGSSSGTGAEAYTLLGGTFAKGLIKSLGIDVDYLELGQNNEEQLSLEIGKKFDKGISVLYLRKDGLDGAKVRVEHSKSFETDIIIQPPNTSSIEFLYKRDR